MPETPSGAPGARTYRVSLVCPVCGGQGDQTVLRARQTQALSVPGRPFYQAYGWAHGSGRAEDSPLYHGLCLCPSCRFPGLESDFRLEVGTSLPNRRSLRKLFLEDRIGLAGPVATILGTSPEALPQPERAVRWNLAAIRAETLPYPEFWRRQALAQLHLRLALLYVDELHFAWASVTPGEPPRWLEEGPNAQRLLDLLSALDPLRSNWPEIPLQLAAAQEKALAFHREVYELRAGEPDPIESVLEERRLARLYGMTGRLEPAREMLARARNTCARLRVEAARRQERWQRGSSLPLHEAHELPALIQRLNRLSDDLAEDRRRLFGPQAQAPGVAPVVGHAAAGGTERPRGQEGGRRKFRLFR